MSELQVPDGALLVLYTDGLIDATSCDPAVGMGRMAGLLRTLPAEGLDRMCDSLTRALLPGDQQQADDAALLVARVRATASDAVASWPLPEDPRAAGAARRYVRDQLVGVLVGDDRSGAGVDGHRQHQDGGVTRLHRFL